MAETMAGTEDDNSYESDPTLPGSACGIMYQLKLLTLLLIRGVRDQYEFQLGSEVKRAGKFDDVTFKYNNKLILIQMKHRKDDATVINMDDLVSKNGNYRVATYFQSWRETKRVMKNITDVVLFTNVNFNVLSAGGALTAVPPERVLCVECLTKTPTHYRLTAAPDDRLYQSLQAAPAKASLPPGTSWDDDLQDDIAEFLETFHLAVHQPSEDELGRAAMKELRDMFPLDTADIVYKDLHQEILHWFTTSINNKKEYFTRESSAGMLNRLYNRVNLFKALERSELYSNRLRGYGLLFRSVSSELSAFMRGDAEEPVFQLEAGHALVGAAAALQAWDWLVFVGEHPSGGCIRLQLSSLLLPGVGDMVMRALDAAGRRGLLLLECDIAWGVQGAALAAELAAALGRGARLVLVSGPGSAALPGALRRKPAVWEEDHRNFLHLLPDAQARILNTNVTLQGRTVQLKAVFGGEEELYSLIDADALVSIISCGDSLVEIAGSANPALGRYDLTSYVDRSLSQKDAEPVSEQTVAADASQATVIISDVAGSGKSMVLAGLAKKISELNPADWLIRLDLNDYTSVLKRKSSAGEDVLIDDLLRWETAPELSGKLLRHSLRAGPRKVTVMLDGFDEISPDYKAATIQLMTDLLRLNTRLLVTTRPHLRSDLERALGASAYSLRPLTTDEQYAFLKEYWRQNLLGVQLPEARMNRFASGLIVNISQSLSESFTSFCGSPLQLKMLAELYIDIPDGPYQGCKQFCETFDADPQLPAKINISELYEKFVNRKISICYYDKQNVQGSNLFARENVEEHRESFFMKHQLLALRSLSSDSVLSADEHEKLRGYMLRIQADQERGGLLAGAVDGRPVFVHRTFAEFFLAKHFTGIVRSQNLACRELVLFILQHLFVKTNYEVSRHFIDSQLAEHVGKIGFLLDNMKQYDIDYFRIIQLSFKEGTTHISTSFLRYIRRPMQLRGDFNVTLNYDMTDVLEQAGRLERLLSREPNEDPAVLGAVMDRILAYMGEVSPGGTTLGSLLQSGVDINAPDDCGNTVIHNFIEKDWEYRAPSAQSDDHSLHSLHSYSPFNTNSCTHEVYCRVRSIIILYLMFYGANVDSKNNLGQTPLMLAIRRNARDIVKLLVDAGCDLAARDAEGSSVLEWTVRFRKVYDIYYSTEPSPDHGELTHTHVASPSCYVLYYVFGNVARIDARDDRGSTVVHACIEKGWPSVSDSVLIHSYLPSTHVPDDTTVESVRRQVRQMIMRMIFSRLPDINIRNGRGQTPLMLAVRANDIDMIDLLLDFGSDISLSDGEGRSILAAAAEYCDADVAQFLVFRSVLQHCCFRAIVTRGPEI